MRTQTIAALFDGQDLLAEPVDPTGWLAAPAVATASRCPVRRPVCRSVSRMPPPPGRGRTARRWPAEVDGGRSTAADRAGCGTSGGSGPRVADRRSRPPHGAAALAVAAVDRPTSPIAASAADRSAAAAPRLHRGLPDGPVGTAGTDRHGAGRDRRGRRLADRRVGAARAGRRHGRARGHAVVDRDASRAGSGSPGRHRGDRELNECRAACCRSGWCCGFRSLRPV